MTSHEALDYYTLHYQGASPEEWKEWHLQGAWPSKKLNKNLSEFDICDMYGVVYRTLARFAPFNRTLDIGCSAGDFLVPIRRASNESYGIDIASFPGAWNVLEEKYSIKCQQFNIDKGQLPFKDNIFSAITMVMVLEHVFDVEHSVKEISRVLEPKGIAIIQVPNIAYLKRRIQLLFGKFPITADTSDPSFEKSWDGQHLHNFTLASLQTLFSRNNLIIEDCRCFGRFAKIRSLWPSLLGGDLTILARRVD